MAIIDTGPFSAPGDVNRVLAGWQEIFREAIARCRRWTSSVVCCEMELWSADEVVTHRTGSRVRKALTSARTLGRRHFSYLLYALAVVGVPAAVVFSTGGPETIGFWIVALVWLAAVIYGAVLVVFIAFLVLSPVLLMVDRMIPAETDSVVGRMSRLLVIGLAVAAFISSAQLGDGSGVRLPMASPSLGALMVISVAAATVQGLWSTAGRLKPVRHHPAYIRRHSVPEPDEEYWSDQYVVGWRSWNWDGSALRGVYARWPSAELEASCRYCEKVPSWGHVCGIYAAKTPDDVHAFHGGSSIVGRVEMWGDVIEHDRGYRASHARITALWVDDPRRADRIRAAYPSVEVSVGSLHLGQEVA